MPMYYNMLMYYNMPCIIICLCIIIWPCIIICLCIITCYVFMLFNPFQPSCSLGNQTRVTKIIANQGKPIAAELLYPPITQEEYLIYSPLTTREEVANFKLSLYFANIFLAI